MGFTSYPAVGTGGFTAEQWASAREAEDGLVNDYTGGAAALTYVSSTVAHIGPCQVSVNGYVLVIDDTGLDFTPATGTVYVAAMYDPALNVADGGGARSADGPCRLVCAASLSSSGGKKYTYLYRMVRAGGQDVDQSTVTNYLRDVGTVALQRAAGDIVTMPAEPYPSGSVLVRPGAGLNNSQSPATLAYRKSGTPGWVDLGRAEDFSINLTSPLVAFSGSQVPTATRQGDMVSFGGIVKRDSGNLSNGSTVTLGTTNQPPAQTGRWMCATNSNTSARVSVDTDGSITMADPPAPVTYVDLSMINYRRAS